MLPVPDTDISGNDFAAALRRVIRCDRAGHRLMTAYYLAAAIVTITGCVLAPPAAGIISGTVVMLGTFVLVIGPTCLVMGIQYSRRQRRPYREAMEQKAAEAARAAPQPGP